jgi:hypothetical protein
MNTLMVMTTTLSRLASACAPALLLWALAAPASAQTVTYKCTEPSGTPLYTDTFRAGCKAIETSGAIPAPASVRSAPARAPVTAPADFPRVDVSQQRARDNDRREILNDELRSEEKRLMELKSEFNNGEPERNGNERNYAKYQARVIDLRTNIGRSEKNIEALKREIAAIK